MSINHKFSAFLTGILFLLFPLCYWPYLQDSDTLPKVLWICLTNGIAAVLALRSETPLLKFSKSFVYVLAAFTLWLGYSTFLSHNQTDAVFELLRLCSLACGAYFMVGFLSDYRIQLALKQKLLLSIPLVVMVAWIIAWLIVAQTSKQWHLQDIQTVMANKNYLAEALVLVCYVILLVLPFSKKSLLVIFCTLMFLLILQSTTSWIAAVPLVILLLYNIQHNLAAPYKTYFKFGKWLLPFLLLALLFNSTIKQQLQLKWNGIIGKETAVNATSDDNSGAERRLLWSASWSLIKRAPIAGQGLNNWKIEMPTTGIQGSSFVNSGVVHYEHPHNDYLLLWSETGSVGLVLVSALLVLLIMALWQLRTKPAYFNFAVTALAALLSLALLALFNCTHLRMYSCFLIFVLVFLIQSKYTNEFPSTSFSIPTSSKALFMGVLLLQLPIAYIAYARFDAETHMKAASYAQFNKDWNSLIANSEAAQSKWYPVDMQVTPALWYEGLAHFNLGYPEQALADWKSALTLNPNHVQLLSDIGAAYSALNHEDSAIYYYNRCLQLYPKFASAFLNKSQCFYKLHQIDSSVLLLNKALQLQPFLPRQKAYRSFIYSVAYTACYFHALKMANDSVPPPGYQQLMDDSLLCTSLFVECAAKGGSYTTAVDAYINQKRKEH